MTHNNLDALINTARIGLEPLDAHYIEPQEAAFKNDYLTLLFALLLENGALNDNQQRLMTLLLAAINPSLSLSHYLQQASKLDADKLRHILDNLRQDQHASQALLFDFVVAQRIAGPLSTTTAERLSWIAKLTGLHEEQLLHINFWSMQLLGIKTELSRFSCIAKTVKIFDIEFISSAFINPFIRKEVEQKEIPKTKEYLIKGKYKYTCNNGVLYIIRTAIIDENGIVFNLLIDNEKNKDSRYGKDQPIFEVIYTPIAFSAWQSFFYRELP
ncbi:hypothetical protein AACK17_18530 [Pectobacterium punjabense]|uniref:hypothetical protein n=1 Tax=Pectobacterium punjabense TaxID=2108399 RepID=UPI00311E341B